MEIQVAEKDVNEYVAQAKEALEKGEVIIKGKARDTVKAVDVAEILKIEGAKVTDIKIDTEEANEQRTSVITIKLQK